MHILHKIRKFAINLLFAAEGLLLIQVLVFPNTLDIVILLLIGAVLIAFTYN